MSYPMRDEAYMQLAYDLAVKGRGKTSPNPMVGAVLVKGGRVIGRGWHKRCGGPHAEIYALQQAGAAAQGAKLYVTLEPCFRQGRTPPCVDAIIARGIKEVVVGVKDPNPETHGKSIRKLRRAGIAVRVGFLQASLTELNAAFNKYIRFRRPWVVAKTAQTLDGKIATFTGDSKWITSLKSRRLARKLRNEFDAICVGCETVLKDDPSLHPADKRKRLKKIVLDSSLRIPLSSKLFKETPPEDCLVATTESAEIAQLRRFKKNGISVISCPSDKGRVDLAWLMSYLAQKEIASLLIEGGAGVIGSALQAKLVDRMYIFIAPKILGDQNARSPVAGFHPRDICRCLRLNILDSQKTGQDMFIKAQVNY